MTGDGSSKIKDLEPEMANLGEDEVVSNQEAVCVPWLAGERKLAVHWVSPIYKQFTRDAPTPSGKK